MKKRIILSIIALFCFVFSINLVYADHDSYLATIKNEVRMDFASYKPEIVNFKLNYKDYTIKDDFSNVVNFNSVSSMLDEKSKGLLIKNSFVVFETPEMDQDSHKRMYSIYRNYKKSSIPLFVTTDSMLHTFHILYDYSLRAAEYDQFIEYLDKITDVMLTSTQEQLSSSDDPFVIDSINRNLAYFAVAMKLLNPSYAVPAGVSELVNAEIALIEAHEGKECSPIFGYYEDYSQYVPRGHYTRNDEFKKFFKAMMWYGRMMYRLKPEGSTMNCGEITKYQETLRAILMCQALLKNTYNNEPIESLWEKIYQPTVFFVGKSDDLSFKEYKGLIAELYGENFTSLDPDEFYDTQKLDLFIEKAMEFQDPLINSSFVFETEDAKDVTKGFRFMGQRFIPDSYMLGQLVHKYVDQRMMPKGLDVMAVLGSSRALQILDYDYRETINPTYMPQLTKLRNEFSSLGDENWVQNLYWNWLYALFPCMTSKEAGFPKFMTNTAWKDKELNTVLGSWTELRHDTILYAKQSYTSETSMPEIQKGYVEPNPELFYRLASLSDYMRDGLKDRGLLNADFESRFDLFSMMQRQFGEIARKELVDEAISQSEYEYIYFIDSNLEMIETFPNDNPFQNGEDSQVALVADVHTDPNSGTVLEEAIGNPDTMMVVAPRDDELYAYAGPVFSYYEFTHPMSDRLTDGAWQTMVGNGENPPHPCWFETFHSGDIQPTENSYPLTVNISSNDTYFHKDDTLKLSITLNNKEYASPFDLYLAFQLPTGDLIFFSGFSNEPEPLKINIPTGSLFTDVDVLVTPVLETLPKGSYLIFCGICEENTYNLVGKISYGGFLVH
jgi:hypothetical protein